jgi:hypothetical protein
MFIINDQSHSYDINFKFCFYGCVICDEMNKTRYACICFEEFINQLNLLYICIYLYLQWDTSYETHKLDRGPIFFAGLSLVQ